MKAIARSIAHHLISSNTDAQPSTPLVHHLVDDMLLKT